MNLETLSLRPYQKEDVEFLKNLKNAGCFNEQRTGKTPTALMTIKGKQLENERVLIITTKSALYQWQYEYKRWLGKPCVVVDGTPTEKRKIINEQWTNGLVVSLGSFKKTKSREGLVQLILSKNPKMAILDEAHYISNPTTCNAESIYKLDKIPNKLALTGTPAYSTIEGIFGILHWLFPNDFKNIWEFRNKYLQPELKVFYDRFGKQVRQDFRNATFKRGAETELQIFLNKYCTQRKRKNVMQWLPQKDKQIIHLPLTTNQQKYLNDLETEYKTEHITTFSILDRLIRYRQICLAPELIGLKGKSPKTDWILNFIKENEDTPLLIFSNFTEYLKRLFITLKENNIKEAMIIGDVSSKTRQKYQTDFQNGKFNVFLINIKSGREALTLDRAEVIIFADAFPPIGEIEQAEDRFISTSETKKDKSHTIYYLAMENSYDETILKLLQMRKTETEVINDFREQLKIKQGGNKNE